MANTHFTSAGTGGGGGNATADNQVIQINKATEEIFYINRIDGTADDIGINGPTAGTNALLVTTINALNAINFRLQNLTYNTVSSPGSYIKDYPNIQLSSVLPGASFVMSGIFIIGIYDSITRLPIGLSNFPSTLVSKPERAMIEGNVQRKYIDFLQPNPRLVDTYAGGPAKQLNNAIIACDIFYATI